MICLYEKASLSAEAFAVVAGRDAGDPFEEFAEEGLGGEVEADADVVYGHSGGREHRFGGNDAIFLNPVQRGPARGLLDRH